MGDDVDTGSMTSTIGKDAFNTMFQQSQHHIIKRTSSQTADIFYRRFTDVDSFEPYDYMACNWFSTDNVLDVDFALYSSLDDALADQNRWMTCNYDDAGVGFPRDCGPDGSVGGEWSTIHVEDSSCNRFNDGGVPAAFWILRAGDSRCNHGLTCVEQYCEESGFGEMECAGAGCCQWDNRDSKCWAVNDNRASCTDAAFLQDCEDSSCTSGSSHMYDCGENNFGFAVGQAYFYHWNVSSSGGAASPSPPPTP